MGGGLGQLLELLLGLLLELLWGRLLVLLWGRLLVLLLGLLELLLGRFLELLLGWLLLLLLLLRRRRRGERLHIRRESYPSKPPIVHVISHRHQACSTLRIAFLRIPGVCGIG